MGWLDKFKRKEVQTCFICNKQIHGSKYSILKYQYTDESGGKQLADATLCDPCADAMEKKAMRREDVESL